MRKTGNSSRLTQFIAIQANESKEGVLVLTNFQLGKRLFEQFQHAFCDEARWFWIFH